MEGGFHRGHTRRGLKAIDDVCENGAAPSITGFFLVFLFSSLRSLVWMLSVEFYLSKVTVSHAFWY